MSNAEMDHAVGRATYAMVYTTFPDLAAARACARSAIEEKLAACVNIIPGVVAIYRWEGEISEEGEVVALFKTRSERTADLMAAIRAGHSYENPALAVYDMADGSPDYLAWIAAGTGMA